MTREEFIKSMHLIDCDENIATEWADWAAATGRSYEHLNTAFYGIHQQYGGELQNLMYLQGPKYVELHPNEFLLQREYLDAEGDIGPSRQDYDMHTQRMGGLS
jgi:hypothetical protein